MSDTKIFEDLLKTHIEWLKFSEAKNIALTGFNLAIIAIFIRYNFNYSVTLILAFLFPIISLTLILFSISPFSGWKQPKESKTTEHDNLFLYFDIAKYGYSTYEKKFSELLNISISPLERMYLKQIHTLAQIVTNKFKFFTPCALIAFLALPTLLLDVFWKYQS